MARGIRGRVPGHRRDASDQNTSSARRGHRLDRCHRWRQCAQSRVLVRPDADGHGGGHHQALSRILVLNDNKERMYPHAQKKNNGKTFSGWTRLIGTCECDAQESDHNQHHPVLQKMGCNHPVLSGRATTACHFCHQLVCRICVNGVFPIEHRG